MDEVLPAWMTDGKGLRGDAGPAAEKRLEFPSAQISRADAESAMGENAGLLALPDGVFNGQPWIKQSVDMDSGTITDFKVWFGEGTSSFAGEAEVNAIPIKAFEFEVGDPEDDTASSMSLIIGDDDMDNDGLNFRSDDNLLQLDWTTQCEIYMTDTEDDKADANQIDILLDASNGGNPMMLLTDEEGSTAEIYTHDNIPEIELKDKSDNGMSLKVDGNPQILLADVYDDVSSGNSIALNLTVGPQVLLQDDSPGPNTIDININDTPIVKLSDGTNSVKMDVADGPEVYLDDGAGNNIQVDVNGGTPEIDIEQSDGASANLSAGDLELFDGDSTTTSLTAGDLELSDSGSGDNASLTSGDLELTSGGSGNSISISFDGLDSSASFQQTKYFDENGYVNTTYILRGDEDSDEDISTFNGLVFDAFGDASTGDILYYDGSEWVGLGIGDAGAFLTVSDGLPAWLGDAGTGDILYYDGSKWVGLGIGSEGDFLTVSGGVPAWVSPNTDCSGDGGGD